MTKEELLNKIRQDIGEKTTPNSISPVILAEVLMAMLNFSSDRGRYLEGRGYPAEDIGVEGNLYRNMDSGYLYVKRVKGWDFLINLDFISDQLGNEENKTVSQNTLRLLFADTVKLQSKQSQVVDSDIVLGNNRGLFGTSANGSKTNLARLRIESYGMPNQKETVIIGTDSKLLSLNTAADMKQGETNPVINEENQVEYKKYILPLVEVNEGKFVVTHERKRIVKQNSKIFINGVAKLYEAGEFIVEDDYITIAGYEYDKVDKIFIEAVIIN